MDSCLYKATVMHHRFLPKRHSFHYNVFMFYVSLDELAMLQQKLKLFSIDRFNFFSFRKNEHLQLPANDPDRSKSTRAHITTYLADNGIQITDQKIMLLTNMNVLGYNFNPVSFYFIFDRDDKPLCAVAEVSNTYREMKPFLLGNADLQNDRFSLSTKKYFYVSPFLDHDNDFHFDLGIPGQKLNIKIDTIKNGEKVFISTLTGIKRPLTNRALLWYSLRFPLIPLRIMFLIHWNALLLWAKKITYHPKAANPELQQNVYKRYKK